MSGTEWEPAGEERELRAGEYVLGTLDAADAAAVAAEARRDPALAAAIDAWQVRLAPLVALVEPVAPPPDLWARIAEDLHLSPPQRVKPPASWRRRWQDARLWRWTTGASLAAAAALLAVTLLRAPAEHRAAALLPVGGAKVAFLADALPAGGLRLTALAPASVPSGRDLELWALPPGATRPVSLGVLPATQRLVVRHPGVRLALGTQLMVSLEPKGGSPTGLPTGPVLFAGSLTD